MKKLAYIHTDIPPKELSDRFTRDQTVHTPDGPAVVVSFIMLNDAWVVRTRMQNGRIRHYAGDRLTSA